MARLFSQAQAKLSSLAGGHSGRQHHDAEGSSPTEPQSGRLAGVQQSFRALQAQYGRQASPEVHHLQLLITTQKGLSLNYENAGADAKSFSKELFIWSQNEDDDVKDVFDRLAYLNYMHGTLASELSVKLNERTSLKLLRDLEVKLAPRRAVRADLNKQILACLTDPAMVDFKLKQLEGELAQCEAADKDMEHEVDLLKRKSMREAEQIKWAGLREFSEKVLLLAQAAEVMLDVLPEDRPTNEVPYAGAEITSSTRLEVEHALQNYKSGQPNFSHINPPPPMPTRPADMSKLHHASFGETHATELEAIPAPTSAPVASPTVMTGRDLPGGERGEAEKKDGAPVRKESDVGLVVREGQVISPDESAIVHPALSADPKPPIVPAIPSPSNPPPPTVPVVPTPTTPYGRTRSTSQSSVPLSPTSQAHRPAVPSPSINPLELNNTPAQIPPGPLSPTHAPSSPKMLGLDETGSSSSALALDLDGSVPGPTVAETGTPLVAGKGGPGPRRGSLRHGVTPAEIESLRTPYGVLPSPTEEKK